VCTKALPSPAVNSGRRIQDRCCRRRLATRPAAAYRWPGMTKRPRSTATLATDLSTSERVLLFCVAGNTEWERAGITGATGR
jgi:hypothetical protein